MGVAGSFKTGFYSKYLPKRLLKLYASAMNDPELLNLRDEIALIDVRLMDLVSQADDDSVWPEILLAIEKRRKLVESEMKIQTNLQVLVNVEQVMVLLDSLMESIISIIKDKDMLRAIQKEFSRITGA